jgi:hypothetical protein
MILWNEWQIRGWLLMLMLMLPLWLCACAAISRLDGGPRIVQGLKFVQ